MPERLPGIGGILARFLPRRVVERMFAPAYMDLFDDRAPHTRNPLFAVRALAMAVECAVRSAAEFRPRRPKGVTLMIGQDLRFALRVLWKSPGFTLVATLALALGIGANTAIFSVVEAVLLKPLPYGDPDRVMSLTEAREGRQTTVSPPNFVDWKAQNQTFDQLTAYNDVTATLSSGGEAERVDAAYVGAGMLETLGVHPLLGRGFLPAEERQGSAPVVVLSHGLWQRRFGSDAGIIGRAVSIDSTACTVVGILPPAVSFPETAQLWLPLVLTSRDTSPNQRGAHYLSVVGRLRAGVSVDKASADLNRIEQAIAAQFPDKVAGYSVSVEPLLDSIVGDLRRPLWLLLGAVVCVLLIACANVSNLLLARATTRRAEIAVRSALGAGRWRIVRQLLAESVTLSLVGGIAGVTIASWAVRGLAVLLPEDLPRAGDITVDLRVMAFSLVVSLLTGLVFGLAPALYGSTADLATFLKDARRDGSAAGGRRTFRSALVAIEIALALILLAGAGLALRSFDRLSRVDPGFNAAHVLSVNVALPEARYPDARAVAQFYAQFQERIEAQPGVVSAGAVMMAPLAARGGFGGSFGIIGRTPEEAPESMQVRPATPGYFETLKVPLRKGRYLTAADREGAPPVAVISEDSARRFWPGQDPIGQRIRIHVGIYTRDTPREVVGVVGDVKTGALAAAIRPVVYVPHAQYPSDVMTLFVRGAGDPMELVAAVKSPLASLDREVAITEIRPAAALVSAAVSEPRFRMLLLALFALLAVVLAAVGLYGVTSFSVNQRRTELGLRIALGADAGQVLRLVLFQGLVPVAIGIAAGVAGAVVLTRGMSTLLYETPSFDPAVFAAVAGLLGVVAALACYIPARRATAVDPMIAMRSE